MTHHIGGAQPADGHPFHPLQHLGRLDQAAELTRRQIDLGGVAGDDHPRSLAQTGEHHAHLGGGGVLGLIEDHEGIGQGAAAHVGQRRHLDHVLLDQGGGALLAQQGVQGVVEGAQVGVHLLLQVAWQEAEPLACLHGGAREDQPLHLALLQHAHGLHGSQEGLAGAGGAEGQGEVVALDRLHVGLLFEGARAQQLAGLAAGQHLAAELLVFFAAAGVEGCEGRLHIHLGDGLALLPERPQQLNQAGGPFQLAGPSAQMQRKTPQHQ